MEEEEVKSRQAVSKAALQRVKDMEKLQLVEINAARAQACPCSEVANLVM